MRDRNSFIFFVLGNLWGGGGGGTIVGSEKVYARFAQPCRRGVSPKCYKETKLFKKQAMVTIEQLGGEVRAKMF
eukprot:1913349-Amphidinium_carterae.1